jgi:hypothetical protein
MKMSRLRKFGFPSLKKRNQGIFEFPSLEKRGEGRFINHKIPLNPPFPKGELHYRFPFSTGDDISVAHTRA